MEVRVRVDADRNAGVGALRGGDGDNLITPELGGAAEAANLWPERYGLPNWNARVKDQLEDLLPRLVCKGSVSLAVAQQAIAADWIAAYKKYSVSHRKRRGETGRISRQKAS